jgi:hypothetical protein
MSTAGCNAEGRSPCRRQRLLWPPDARRTLRFRWLLSLAHPVLYRLIMKKPTNERLPAIDSNELHAATGGAGAIQAPIVPMPNMGAPKYSAAWWDFVRSRGLHL